VFVVPVSTTGVGANVVTSGVSVVGSVVAVSGKRLRTIGSHVKPSLFGVPPLQAESS
jgi:hypothetical protein